MSDAARRAAWRAALYRVHDGQGWIDTRIDQPSAALAELLAGLGAERASLVTACNPYGRRLDDTANARRLATLQAELASAGYRWLPAEGAAADRSWVEPSLWVPGLAGTVCLAVMQRHEQLAWVEYDARGIGRLQESGLGAHTGDADA